MGISLGIGVYECHIYLVRRYFCEIEMCLVQAEAWFVSRQAVIRYYISAGSRVLRTCAGIIAELHKVEPIWFLLIM